MLKRSPRNGIECETDDHGNGTSIRDENDWRTSASHSVIQIDDFNDGSVIETVETEPSDDTTAVENGGPPNANAYEMERNMIATQSTSDEHKFNDR